MKPKKASSTATRRESTPYLEASRHFGEAIELLHVKSYKKARDIFQSILDDYPDEKEISDRCRTYIQICDRLRIKKEDVLTEAEEYYTRGTVRFNERDYEGAIRDYQEAMRLSPKDDYIPYTIAGVYALKGDVDDAAKALAKAIKLNPDYRKQARNDDDFGGMLEEPAFVELLKGDD